MFAGTDEPESQNRKEEERAAPSPSAPGALIPVDAVQRQELVALRERAAKLGFKVHKRGGWFLLIDAEGHTRESVSDIEGVEMSLAGREGKIALQAFTACGILIEGMNNSKAWLA